MPCIQIETSQKAEEEVLGEVVEKMYDLEADYRRMQELLTASPNERPPLFDDLRKNYPVRREFHTTSVTLPKNQEKLRQMFAGIGFSDIREEG